MQSIKRLTLVCLFINVFISGIQAQDNFLKDYAPVAPNAAALGKYGDIPVGYHTGVPDISIPIYTLSEGSLNVPVSLSYHASGIRVQETASWVGLGWALNAGGVITRTVQGAPDEGGGAAGTQYWGWYKNKGSGMANNLCPPLTAVASGLYDTEPDIFNFNVGGYSGKFFYDQDTIIQIVPKQDIVIKTINLGSQIFSGWILIDPMGNKYHFGATNTSMALNDYVEKSAYSADPLTTLRNSSWYLSKIESADGKDVIQFSYVEDKYSFWEVSNSPANGGIINTSNPGNCTGGTINAPIRARITGKRLSSITGSNGSIIFTGDSNPRLDLSNYNYCPNPPFCTTNTEAKRLKTIEVRDKTGACLRKFEFTHAYSAQAPAGSLPAAQLPSNGDETDRIRLVLNSISEQECSSANNSKTYSFEYYDINSMPRRISYAQDHWGYYNGKNSNSSMAPGYASLATICNTCQGNYAHLCTTPPDNREPAFPAMRNGALKKITYPTGGFTNFDFEAHTVWGADTICTETNIDAYSASTGSCNNGGVNSRSYTFTADEINQGHIELKWSNPFYIPGSCTASGSATLEVYNSGGTILTSFSTGGNNSGPAISYSYLKKIGNITLSPGVSYTFKLITSNGIGEIRLYKLIRTETFSNKIVGGLRVKTITTSDGLTSNNLVKNYEYRTSIPTQSSGKLVYKPLYVGLYIVKCPQIGAGGCTDTCSYDLSNENTYLTCPPTGIAQPLRAVYSSSGLQPMQTTQGSHIGYTTVRVFQSGNGTSVYYYNMGSYANGPWTPGGFPFPPPPYDPLLGTQLAEEQYTETGNLVFTRQTEYQTATINAVSGFNALKVHTVMPSPRSSSGVRYYNLTTGYSLPKKYTERQYNADGLTYVEKITDITYSIANGHYQKTTEDVTNSDGTVYRTKFKYALDFPCPTTGTFCDETNTTAVPAAKVILAMRKRNMVAIPIEQTTWLKKTSWGAFRLTNATFFSFGTVGGNYNHIKLDSILQIRPATPLTAFSESAITGTGGFTPASGYVREYNFVYSPTHGKPLSQWKQNDPAKQQYIWGHNQKLPIAKIINAEANEVAFTSFEEQNNSISQGNWTLTGAGGGWINTAGEFVTGRTGFNLSPSRTCTLAQVPAGKYIITCWHKNGSIVVNGTTISTTGATWKLAETEITLSNPTNTVTVSSGASDWSQAVDELRLFPSDALMRSFSFDDRNQLLLSISDENNVAAHYEYDNFQRLQGVRDQDRNLLQTMEYNYRPGGGVLNDIKARTVLIAGQTTLAQVQALSGSNVRYLAQYFDGLARPVQTNAVGQSPAQNDIISFQQYDQYGRENKQYLPYTIATNGGAYRTGFATEQNTFINGFGAGGYGYSETAFEPSALNRATAQSAPGAVWRLGTVTPRYQRTFWRANTVADAVRDFTNNTTFAANTLWMTESVDENGRSRFVFTDKMGRTVLVKQPLNATETAQTYTVYDDFGRVTCVIPPETTKRMVNSSNWDWTSATYAGMIFKYAFDARGRMVAKTIPSTGTTTIAYDRLDRNVLTTDANGVKLYTRYDILSRPVASGRYVGAATAPSGTEPLFETANTTAPHFYSTNTFPTDVANTHIYKIFYYDDYDFNNDGLIGAGETYTNSGESGYDAAAFLRTRGKPTAVKTAILPNTLTAPSTYLSTRTYYDKEYSVIQVNKQNHLGGSDIVHNSYDFANRLTKTRRDHTGTPPGGTLKTYTIREEYVLDHAGRIRFVRHHLGTSTTVPTSGWVVTSAPLYDELGRVVDKRLHASNYNGSSAVTLTSSFSYLQSLDYSYNIRGWLTGINNVASCAVQAGDNLADVFSMKLDYDSPTGGGTAQFNGNISNMQWRTYIGTTCLNQQQYRFSYDYANRLTAADHYTNNGTSWLFTNNYTENNISYDLNGNLKTYTRRGQTPSTGFDVIDQLSYTYGDAARPDRLTQMSDAAPLTTRAKGFTPSSSAITGDHYLYDASGNMTQDKHKGFTIQYNYLNLPIVFTKGSNVITMTYTADGEKLSKAVTGGGAAKNYAGGIEYSGANLEAIYFSEGRCVPNGATAFFYDYTVKDHLGNARVNFRASGTSIVNIEDHHYYPFGMKMEGIGSSTVANKYTYNGKELNDDFGLNLHDYGARWYDAALGRWWSVDPLAEKTPRWSPYHYGFDNPLRFIDPTGMASEAYAIVNKSEEYAAKAEAEKQKRLNGADEREKEEESSQPGEGLPPVEVITSATSEITFKSGQYSTRGTDYIVTRNYKNTIQRDEEGRILYQLNETVTSYAEVSDLGVVSNFTTSTTSTIINGKYVTSYPGKTSTDWSQSSSEFQNTVNYVVGFKKANDRLSPVQDAAIKKSETANRVSSIITYAGVGIATVGFFVSSPIIVTFGTVATFSGGAATYYANYNSETNPAEKLKITIRH